MKDPVVRILQGEDIDAVLESMSTPMPRMGVMAKASTMVKSLRSPSLAPSPKMRDLLPKIKTSFLR